MLSTLGGPRGLSMAAARLAATRIRGLSELVWCLVLCGGSLWVVDQKLLKVNRSDTVRKRSGETTGAEGTAYASVARKRATGACRCRLRAALCPKRSRMFEMRYLIMVGLFDPDSATDQQNEALQLPNKHKACTYRSSPRPHAITRTSSGRPIGRNISGRKMPAQQEKEDDESVSVCLALHVCHTKRVADGVRHAPELPISVHLFSSGWKPKISIDGSVYGLYAGLKRTSVMPICSKKVLMVPIRSPSDRLRSATNPSTWWNSHK